MAVPLDSSIESTIALEGDCTNLRTPPIALFLFMFSSLFFADLGRFTSRQPVVSKDVTLIHVAVS